MVFSLLRPIAGLEKPSQDNAEYINPTISIWSSPITSKTTSVGITINSTLGTKTYAKPKSYFPPLSPPKPTITGSAG
jgi:hypothetical protein